MINTECQQFAAYTLQEFLPKFFDGNPGEVEKFLTRVSTVIPHLNLSQLKQVSGDQQVWAIVGAHIAKYYALQYEPGALKAAV